MVRNIYLTHIMLVAEMSILRFKIRFCNYCDTDVTFKIKKKR